MVSMAGPRHVLVNSYMFHPVVHWFSSTNLLDTYHSSLLISKTHIWNRSFIYFQNSSYAFMFPCRDFLSSTYSILFSFLSAMYFQCILGLIWHSILEIPLSNLKWMFVSLVPVWRKYPVIYTETVLWPYLAEMVKLGYITLSYMWLADPLCNYLCYFSDYSCWNNLTLLTFCTEYYSGTWVTWDIGE